MSEDDDLNQVLFQSQGQMPPVARIQAMSKSAYRYDEGDPFEDDEDFSKSFVHWTTADGRLFIPAAKTTLILTPGVYEIDSSSSVGIYFERIPIKNEGLVRFPDTNSDIVLSEIQKFWEREAIFDKYGLTYKRGILLYGPPGGGKTSAIQLVMEDVVNREGIVIKFTDPDLFIDGMRILRQIQPHTPVVVIMEDIDATLELHNESEILNILDGVNEVRKTVFLATTNYPDKLGPRIVNRPSRFDKRFRIGYPSEISRQIYFAHLFKDTDCKSIGVDIDQWVKDTDKLSIAHLKELFVQVVILGDPYEESLKKLRSMKEHIEDKDYETEIGFGGKKASDDFYN
jgi:hypothetical protein